MNIVGLFDREQKHFIPMIGPDVADLRDPSRIGNWLGNTAQERDDTPASNPDFASKVFWLTDDQGSPVEGQTTPHQDREKTASVETDRR